MSSTGMTGSLASLVRPYEDPQKKLTQGLQGLGSSLEGWAQDVKKAKQKRLNDSLGILLSQGEIDYNKVDDLFKNAGVAEAAIALKAADPVEKAKEREIFLQLGMPLAQIINTAYTQNKKFPLKQIRDYAASRGVGMGRALITVSLLQDSGIVPSAKETRSRKLERGKTLANLASHSGETPITKEAAQRLKEEYGIKANTYPGAFDTALKEYPQHPGPTINAQKYRKNLLAQQMPDENSYTIGHPVAAKTEKPIIKFGFDNIGGQLWKVERIVDSNTGNILSTKKVRQASPAEQKTYAGVTPGAQGQQVKNLIGQFNFFAKILAPNTSGLMITDMNDLSGMQSSMQQLMGILNDDKGKYTQKEKDTAHKALLVLQQILGLAGGGNGGIPQPQRTPQTNISLGQGMRVTQPPPGAGNMPPTPQNQAGQGGQPAMFDFVNGKIVPTSYGNRPRW